MSAIAFAGAPGKICGTRFTGALQRWANSAGTAAAVGPGDGQAAGEADGDPADTGVASLVLGFATG
ncbi:MAG TPA: hypothetical protein VEV45_25550 [Streptosporangiaceae bacterium]|nr:hypothetical protein [Streptosporangiaceae bacterium]